MRRGGLRVERVVEWTVWLEYSRIEESEEEERAPF